jgi:hypothetical protein
MTTQPTAKAITGAQKARFLDLTFSPTGTIGKKIFSHHLRHEDKSEEEISVRFAADHQ